MFYNIGKLLRIACKDHTHILDGLFTCEHKSCQVVLIIFLHMVAVICHFTKECKVYASTLTILIILKPNTLRKDFRLREKKSRSFLD